MVINSVSFTPNGDFINLKIKNFFKNYDFFGYGKSEGLIFRKQKIYDWTFEKFFESDVIIFIGAVGIAVRCVSKYIESKDKDPTVIVIDEMGKFVIPILSGHLGGGNEIAVGISEFIGGQAVVTTATDLNDVFAVDVWAKKNDCTIFDISKIKNISSAILRGEEVGFVSDFEIFGDLPKGLCFGENFKNGIVVSPYIKNVFDNTLNIVPKCVYIGVGSRKNANDNALIDLVYKCFENLKISPKAVCSVNTIDLKKDEKAVLKLCENLNVPLNIFSAEELAEVCGNFSKSEFVKKTVGVDNVCERACCGASKNCRIILKKTVGDGVTLAVGIGDWSGSFESNDVGNRLFDRTR